MACYEGERLTSGDRDKRRNATPRNTYLLLDYTKQVNLAKD